MLGGCSSASDWDCDRECPFSKSKDISNNQKSNNNTFFPCPDIHSNPNTASQKFPPISAFSSLFPISPYYKSICSKPSKINNNITMGQISPKYYLLISLLLASACSEYYTNKKRTDSVEILCDRFTDREHLLQEYSVKLSNFYRKDMELQLQTDGNLLVRSMLQGNADQAEMSNMKADTMAFASPFIVGLIVMVIISVFLLLSCCCPGHCPPKRCRVEKDSYKRSQLLLPSIMLIVSLLLVLGINIYAISKTTKVTETYAAVSCSMAICLDDVINGNISHVGSFFIGLNPLGNQLTLLRDYYMDNVATELERIDSSSNTETSLAISKGLSLLQSLSKLPTGNIGESMSSFTYNNFDGSSGTIQSTFPASLGGILRRNGQIWNTYRMLNTVNSVMSGIMLSADRFKQALPSLTSGITQAIDEVRQLEQNMRKQNAELTSQLYSGQQMTRQATKILEAVFAVLIVLSILGIVGAVIMSFFHRYRFRYLVYCSCGVLFLIGIGAFVVAILMSVVTPVTYYGCEFLDYSVQSGDNFYYNFRGILGEKSASQMMVCMPGEKGQILTKIAPGIYEAVDSMQDAITQLSKFDASESQQIIDYSWTKLTNLIEDTYRSTDLDWNNKGNLKILQDIANPSSYPECASNGFTDDSWIPSTETDAVIKCRSSTGNIVTDEQCDNFTLIAGKNNPPAVCYGCIDTFLVLKQSPSTITADLNARYPSTGQCVKFATDMQTLWDNYYRIKIQKWDTSGLNSRMASADSLYSDPTNGYYTRVANVGQVFNSIMSNFTGGIDSITNPDYGMIAGLNCQLLGEDLQLVVNVTCARLFNVVYSLRLVFGITGFGILFAMCFATCSGVRHYKHSVKTRQSRPDENQSQNYDASFNAMADKEKSEQPSNAINDSKTDYQEAYIGAGKRRQSVPRRPQELQQLKKNRRSITKSEGSDTPKFKPPQEKDGEPMEEEQMEQIKKTSEPQMHFLAVPGEDDHNGQLSQRSTHSHNQLKPDEEEEQDKQHSA